MDEILREPDSPSPDLVLDLEVKSLRDTRDLLEKVGLKVNCNPGQELNVQGSVPTVDHTSSLII